MKGSPRMPQTPSAASASPWRALFAQSPTAMVVVDRAGCIVEMNAVAETLTGVPLADATGQEMGLTLGIIDPTVIEACRVGTAFNTRAELHTPTGGTWWAQAHVTPLSDDALLVTLADETAHRFTELQLREAQQRLGAAFLHAPIGMALCSQSGTVLEPNPRLTEMFGRAAHEILGAPIFDLVDDRSRTMLVSAFAEVTGTSSVTRTTIEVRLEGTEFERWAELSIAAVTHDHDAVGYVIMQAQDVSERRRAERALRLATLTDSLTGLANRSLLRDRLQQALHRRLRHEHDIAVIFLDLDRFKLVNDTHGHDVGDKVLQEVGRRLREVVRPEDTVARIGGDEFVVLLEDLRHGIDEAMLVAERMHEALREPIALPSGSFTPSASIGIAEATPTSSADRLLREADTAMYRAKDTGRARSALFDDSLRQQAMARLGAERLVRKALEDDRVVVCYQPVVDLATGDLAGAEALVRLRDTEGGLLSPAMFLNVAEETGLIVPLGEVVLRRATLDAAAWRREVGNEDMHVAVNVSLRQLDAAFVEVVKSALIDSGLPREALILEVTESILLDAAPSAITILNELHNFGIRLSLDDFGTGYSSLTALRQFPIDIVKADRSFVSNATADDEDRAIVETVVALGDRLGLQVVAEGVETREDLQMLVDIGAHLAQGYLFGRPMENVDFRSLMRLRSPLPANVRLIGSSGQEPEDSNVIQLDRVAGQ